MSNSRKMWFGTEQHAQWVPAPSAGLEVTHTGYASSVEMENGGTWIERSKARHRSYGLNFPAGDPRDYDGIDAFLRFDQGLYGSPIRFVDPMQVGTATGWTNILAPQWAFPYLSRDGGWKPIHSDVSYGSSGAPNATTGIPSGLAIFSNLRPVDGFVAPNTYPPCSEYTILLPPGYTLRAGFRGSRTGSGRVNAHVKLRPGGPLWNGPLLLTNLATNPSFETGSGTVEVRRNLVTNPRAASSTGWSAAGVSTTFTTVDGPFGVSITAVQGNFDAAGDRIFFETSTSLAAGTYTASMYVRAPVGKSIRVSALGFGGSPSYAAGLAVEGTGEWQRQDVTFAAPGGSGFRIEARQNVASADGTVQLTALLVEASPVLRDYFDGSTSAGGDFTYAWTGTANASASVQNAVGVTGASGGVGRAVFQSQQWAESGTKSLRIRSTGANTSGTNANGAIVARNDSTAMATLSGGVTYTAVATVRLESPQTGSILDTKARRMWLSNDLGSSVAASSPQAPNEAGEHRIVWTFTTATGIDSGSMLLYLGGGTAAGSSDVWWDDFALIEGTYTGDYFDGNTPEGVYRYAWTGAANESTSTQSVNTNLSIPLTSSGSLQWTAEFDGDNYEWVKIYLARGSETDSTVSLQAGWASIAPNGTTPPLDKWTSGRGAWGCEFSAEPVIEQYVYGGGNQRLVGASFGLVEVEPWQRA
jgi:hypothetical protein